MTEEDEEQNIYQEINSAGQNLPGGRQRAEGEVKILCEVMNAVMNSIGVLYSNECN